MSAVTGVCATCGYPIRHLGGPSWRHISKQPGKNHAADPDDATRNANRTEPAQGQQPCPPQERSSTSSAT
jgi:hypothetical protein